MPENMKETSTSDLFRRIPAANASLKIIFTLILAIIFGLLCIPGESPYNKYIARMKEYSPASRAESLFERDGPRAASEFAAFWLSLPNADANAQVASRLKSVMNEAEARRGDWSYKAEEFGRGLIGMEPHEDYARITTKAARYIPYLSDARYIFTHGKSLYENWKKFQNHENVNGLRLGIDGVGLAVCLYGLIPGVGRAADPVKTSTAILNKCLGVMRNEIKDYVLKLFQPAFKFIQKSELLEINASNLAGLSSLVARKSNQFDEAVALIGSALTRLQPLITLCLENWDAARLVLENASSPEELCGYINIANKIDKSDVAILKYGGGNALSAACRLENGGEFNINILKSAMLYGDAGLEAVGNIPDDVFLEYPLRVKSRYSPLRITILALYAICASLAIIRIWRRS